MKNNAGKYKRTKKKRGKPGPRGYFREWMLKDAEELISKAGARNKDLADYFGVAEKTIEHWYTTNERFRRACRRGRMKGVLKVSKSLFNAANGYEHKDTFLTQYQGRVISKEIIKKYPPNVQAAIKYLSIMMKDVWAERSHLEISGKLEHKHIEEIPVEELSEEEKELLYNINLKQLRDEQWN